MIRMQLRHLPNIITCLRVLLVIPVLLALWYQHYAVAFYLFVIAGLSDAIDGLLARWFECTSRFGAFVDPLADKLLLMGSFITLGELGHIPMWLVIVVILRDAWIMGGALAYLYFIGRLEFVPTLMSKGNTFFQLLLVTILLIDLSFIELPIFLIQSIYSLVFVTSIISFIQYTWIWSMKAIKSYKTTLKSTH